MIGCNQIIKKLKSNIFINASVIYIFANGIGQGTTLLANTFFTRYMSQNDYGLFSNYYSYVSILVPFVGMNLYCGLTNAYIDYRNEIKKLRSSVLLLSVFGFVGTTIIVSIIKMTIGLSLSWLCILLALTHSYGFFLVNYYINAMNMEKRYIAKGVLLAIPNILQALLAGIFILICNTFVSRVIGSSSAIFLCGIFAACCIIKEAKPIINLEYWRFVLCISLPAIIGSVSAMIMQQCDKVMITSMLGAESTAVYALIYNIGYILYAVQQATNGVWQVWIYNTLERNSFERITTVQKWYMYIMLVITTILYMLAPEIIKFLAPENYWSFEYVIPFIIGSYLMLSYTMNMSISQYYKKTGVNSFIVFIAALINISLNYALIPKLGGVGAAYTSVVSYFFIFVISGIYLILKKKFYFSIYIYLSFFSLVLGLGLLFYFMMNVTWMRLTVFSIMIVLELVYLSRRREELRDLLT